MKAKNTKLFNWQQRTKNDNKLSCCECGRKDELTVDHIIACSLIDDFFYNDKVKRYFWLYDNEDNFQIMCKFCNDAKKRRLDFNNQKTKLLLLKILNEL